MRSVKWEPRKVEVAPARRAARRALRAVRDRRGASAPDDWMIHRMDPPAGDAAEPMPERHRADARPRRGQPAGADAAGRSRSSGTACARSPTGAAARFALESRNLNDITDSYPEIARLDRALGSREAVLDGELVAFDAQGGRASALCSSGCTSPRAQQAQRLAETYARDLRDLRPAVARRPFADRAPLRRAPRQAR